MAAYTSIFTGAQIDARLGGNFTGVALTAASVNKLAITAPATSATLTIANGKTFTASNTLTLTGTDGSTLAIGTGGTLGTAAYTAATAYAPVAGPGSSQAFSVGALTSTKSNIGTATDTTEIVNLGAASGSDKFIRFNEATNTFRGLVGIVGVAGSASASSALGEAVIRSETGILLSLGGTTKLKVDSSGNVLIGTATASTGAKLEVAGSGSFTGALTATGLEVLTNGGTIKCKGGTSSTLWLEDTGAGTDQKKLLMRTAGGITTVRALNDADSAYPWDFLTFRHDTGAVLVGLVNPVTGAKLEVAGSGSFTSTMSIASDLKLNHATANYINIEGSNAVLTTRRWTGSAYADITTVSSTGLAVTGTISLTNNQSITGVASGGGAQNLIKIDSSDYITVGESDKGLKIFGAQVVTFGANDSAGTGYRLVRVPNA